MRKAGGVGPVGDWPENPVKRFSALTHYLSDGTYGP